ncbi:succinylglutamate desuccinylase/aspartoacylase domain-containing protein [Variovorax ginsengisoli]|jgi:predicted deacylase|uniref:Succinylglutamate desuccinylase/aspartoacylase family protein n=1 Tax=Variovorax ginsengisoli TaxID=363844 RepID=A0ABT8S6R2_9BURK|nr:succinylglutamate desuccinylase/aspartoacylase family protein [Variovorax ginsengisoli]MDN8615439.1 succinylglutamate desuccinylase/aspartoacylase family protein [Variovorax ginsengisoli]MDO1534609.1 succinylglutamate desuccinylase/aspartoacylase family protein [Variovorax ginsengisoli]
MTDTQPALEVLPRDISAYREGNTGVDYVHRFESGKPGPHVLINALTHGNEICGMVAATHLLDSGVRPKLGTLTVSFAHVEAYNAFDPAKPFENRQIVHNLNRVWSDEWLDGPEDSPELRRARALRPVVAAADHILDIHSTSQDVVPFWVYPDFERNARVATAIGLPPVHLVMPSGLGSGTPLIQHGLHAGADAPGAAMVVECGQHFKQSAADLATEVTLRFLAHFGLIDREGATPEVAAQRRFELLQTHLIKSEDFRFVRPLIGFETFAEGELIATQGTDEIRAPCDDCTVFMPAQRVIVGREAVYLTKPL